MTLSTAQSGFQFDARAILAPSCIGIDSNHNNKHFDIKVNMTSALTILLQVRGWSKSVDEP